MNRTDCCPDLTLSGGAFHYSIRSGTYGDVYDEIPWRVKYGLEGEKGRGPLEPTSRCNPTSAIKQTYSPGVLLNQWTEKGGRNHRIPISQFGECYKTTYSSSYWSCSSPNQWNCMERERELQIKAQPIGAYPGHIPESEERCFSSHPPPIVQAFRCSSTPSI